LADRECASGEDRQEHYRNHNFLHHRHSPFCLTHFGSEGAGPSGWQTPVVPPPTPKKQPHGRLQMSPLVHGLPHATIACVPVRNWWTDNAPDERAAASIVANINLLAM
jgi:hypothetical protein